MPKYTYITAACSNRLKAALIESGINISQAADMMGTSRPTLSSRLNGKTDFSKTEMEAFASIVGKPAQALFLADKVT